MRKQKKFTIFLQNRKGQKHKNTILQKIEAKKDKKNTKKRLRNNKEKC